MASRCDTTQEELNLLAGPLCRPHLRLRAAWTQRAAEFGQGLAKVGHRRLRLTAQLSTLFAERGDRDAIPGAGGVAATTVAAAGTATFVGTVGTCVTLV